MDKEKFLSKKAENSEQAPPPGRRPSEPSDPEVFRVCVT